MMPMLPAKEVKAVRPFLVNRFFKERPKDVAKLMELNSEKQSISEKLEELYERWEELAED